MISYFGYIACAIGLTVIPCAIVIARHEEEARRYYRNLYDLKQELSAERRSRAMAEEQIAVMTRSVIEAGHDLKDMQKKLKAQHHQNAKLKKTMRRKKKSVVGSGKKRGAVSKPQGDFREESQ